MKYLFTLCCSLIIMSSSIAQNLISNASFTVYSACPTTVSEMNLSNSWNQPTIATPDYMNSCATGTIVGIPQNFVGSQASVSNSYAGIFTYYETLHNYREYIRTTVPPLEIGATYKVTIIVSMADTVLYASDGLGVYFCKYRVDSLSDEMLPKTPQVDYTSYGTIANKATWVTLTKNFIADSAYTNVIIGNYKTDTGIHLSNTPDPVFTLFHGSYYYIDSVSVEKIAGPPPAYAYNINNSQINNLHPNPFTNYTTLTFNNDAQNPYTLTIYDIQGRLVRRMHNITTSSIRIERDNLETGFYYYKLYGADGAVDNGRFVIKD